MDDATVHRLLLENAGPDERPPQWLGLVALGLLLWVLLIGASLGIAALWCTR